ncbi:unnamed protein product [Linum trigynum]|uniref:Secreted protein n=1 Tax=Linum trigynum TaxID=586398 RepID=A0AAV2GRH4_9ROSI
MRSGAPRFLFFFVSFPPSTRYSPTIKSRLTKSLSSWSTLGAFTPKTILFDYVCRSNGGSGFREGFRTL